MWDRWVIDAGMSAPEGLFCFCPIEGELDGEFSVVTGMNFLGSDPPHGGRVVAVIHEWGDEAVEHFCEERKADLEALSARQKERPATV